MDQIPADAAVLAVGGGAVKCARQLLLAPCRLFHVFAPSFGFAMHANAGAFRTGFSLAARRSRKSTGFCIFRQMTLYEQLISVCPDCAKCTASRCISIPLYKTCTFLCNKKSRSTSGFSYFGMKKGDRPVWTVAFVNCCEVCLRRGS